MQRGTLLSGNSRETPCPRVSGFSPPAFTSWHLQNASWGHCQAHHESKRSCGAMLVVTAPPVWWSTHWWCAPTLLLLLTQCKPGWCPTRKTKYPHFRRNRGMRTLKAWASTSLSSMGCHTWAAGQPKGIRSPTFPIAPQCFARPFPSRARQLWLSLELSPSPVMYDIWELLYVQWAGSFIQCLKHRWCMKCNLVL